ncbi:MAG: radical SAM protein [Thiotrichales bacterium]|nr:radical SAM protein [Thiotrichales bacterium]
MRCDSETGRLAADLIREDVSPGKSMADARRIMQEQGHWSFNQQMGTRWPIGCVALEITQRCNLDCTLCYLSEYSEAVHDVPLEELFHRIDRIHGYYGDRTDIQVTGGDPTLRKREELLEVIRYIRSGNMRSTLMTNGIRATRSLLEDLACAGLNDVAFHVDTTQQRKGFATEQDLNKVRDKYLQRARGLGLSVVFNTTVHDGNFHELPRLIEYFISRADEIRTVSFQLQAETGRGIEGKRNQVISTDSVWQLIEDTAGTEINHRAIRTGHPLCNRYGMTLVSNNRVINLFDDEAQAGWMQWVTRDIVFDRNNPAVAIRQILALCRESPRDLLKILGWLLNKLFQVSGNLLQAKGRATTLSFFVHNFMDACNLDKERIRACVFKNMTRDGPVSMCEYNARRDEFILQPVPLKNETVIKFWNPLTGENEGRGLLPDIKRPILNRKQRKGRAIVR